MSSALTLLLFIGLCRSDSFLIYPRTRCSALLNSAPSCALPSDDDNFYYADIASSVSCSFDTCQQTCDEGSRCAAFQWTTDNSCTAYSQVCNSSDLQYDDFATYAEKPVVTAQCNKSCNNGVCSGATCKCFGGWQGSDCSVPICNFVCLNGATCTSPNNCTCPPQYFGEQCAFSIPTAAVDGGWSDWGPFTACSVSCGGGLQRQSRQCNNPPPQGAGRYCDNDEVHQQTCNTHPCQGQINATWSSWSAYSNCPVSCGMGYQLRSRQCSNPAAQSCEGAATENRLCGNQLCGIQWGAWTPWATCSVSCGQGTRGRYRQCNVQDDVGVCVGDTQDSDNCPENNPCPNPIDGGWSGWGAFTACPVSCGGAYQQRGRTCSNPAPQFGGQSCSGDPTDQQLCNTQPCQGAIDGSWSDWGAFVACPVSCGGGYQQRGRACSNPAPRFGGHNCTGEQISQRPCNTQSCTVDGQWSAWESWGACWASCGSSTRWRQRHCSSPAPQGGGQPCGGPGTDTQACSNPPCAASTTSQPPSSLPPSSLPPSSLPPAVTLQADGYQMLNGDCNSLQYTFCPTVYCGSPARCAQRCNGTASCVGFRYHRLGNFCYLMFTTCAAGDLMPSRYLHYFNRTHPGIVIPYPEPPNHPLLTGFTDRYGDCLNEYLVFERCNNTNQCGSTSLCANWCSSRSQCMGFTFDFSTKNCALYSQSCSDLSLRVAPNRIHYSRYDYSFLCGCGFPAVPVEPLSPTAGRIIGGDTAKPNSWPWMVQLQRNSRFQFCGGSVISSQWVLTAAHCAVTTNTNNLVVVAGRFNKYFVEPSEQTFEADRIVTHPKFNSSMLDNDIALIHLTRPINMSMYVSPVCLATQEFSEGDHCYVTGWGDIEGVQSPLEAPDTLNQVKIDIIVSGCNKMTNNQVCAGNMTGGQDSCQGDSGGPLVCRNSTTGIFYQYGIVSYGNGCALPNNPGVYTRVPNYIAWIQSITGSPVLH